jgi:hypothetical protein
VNLYKVIFLFRKFQGAAPIEKSVKVVAKSEADAATHAYKGATIFPRVTQKDAKGVEVVITPATSSVEVTGIRMMEADVEVFGQAPVVGAPPVAPKPVVPPAPAPKPFTAPAGFGSQTTVKP